MAGNTSLRAAILIVSDTAYSDPSTDKAGSVLTDVFTAEGAGQWTVSDTQIVQDDTLAIQRHILQWTDGGDDAVNLIVTTGGTGFSTKDNTPEAVRPLIHKHASGLVHGMLAASLEITPFAMMSRPVAGIRNKTLILTLPGSPKGAKENLLAVLKLLPHACLQAAGADSRSIHQGGLKKLEQDAGVSSKQPPSPSHSHHNHHDHHGHGHGHGHGHQIPKPHTQQPSQPPTIISNDPTLGPSHRNRKSPYRIFSVPEALASISNAVASPLEKITLPVNSDLVGHVLAEDVTAYEAVPAFRASIVDGYAIIVSESHPSSSTSSSTSSKGTFPVASVSHASPGEISPLQPGQIARITTGAPLPPGANAVVMVEDTVIRSFSEDGKDEKEVEILTDEVVENENVREIGSDIKQGQVVLGKGEIITPVGGEIGLLASVGRVEVVVFRKPRIGILSTGDEIVEHDRKEELSLGEVRDCNRPTLLAAIRGWGYEVVDLGIAGDKSIALETHLRAGLRQADVLITSGGVSMGELDLLKPTIERSLGGTIHFGRVTMKPGKPTTFATVPFKPTAGDRNASRDRLVFSLPGNPASALVTAHLFVLPALQQLSGRSEPWGLPRTKVVLGQDVKCDAGRPEYHRVRLEAGEDGRLQVYSTGGQRSSRVGSLQAASALLCLPAKDGAIAKGELIDALVMGGLRGL